MKTKSGILLFFIMVAVLATTSCVSKNDFMALQNQMNRDRAQNSQKLAQMETDIATTKQQLTTQIEASSSPMQTSQANLWAQMEQIRMQQAQVADRLDQLSRDMETYAVGQENSTVTMSAMLVELAAIRNAMKHQLGVDLPESSLKAPAAKISENATQAVAPVQAATPPPAVEKQADPAKTLYDTARENFEQRKYDQARRMWGEFIQSFPKNALVPNAYFWQGESYYQMGEYPKAILAYQEVIEKFKKSNKYKTCLLKQGICFYKIGKKKAGKLILEDLVKNYPSSPEAKRAKTVLSN